MFILNNPYISDFLIETIKKNGYKVLNNEFSRKYFDDEFLTNEKDALDIEKFYLNSENSIDWIIENYSNKPIAQMIKISKDKALFRKMLSNIYPNYFYKEFSLNELKETNLENFKYPLVLKPSVGFLSFGVYPVKNKEEFSKILANIDCDIEKFKNVFPSCVVDTSKFIVEDMIEGAEFAIDAYFDKNGKATILNIFQHPFFNEEDVSDRIYFTSKAIIQKYLKPFEELLNKIGQVGKFKNFPMHLELSNIPVVADLLFESDWIVYPITSTLTVTKPNIF